MWRRVQTDKRAIWTDGIAFTAEALELGADELALKDICRYKVTQGVFRLWRFGEGKPLLTCPTSVPNFFPGYAVLVKLSPDKGPTPSMLEIA